MPSRVTAQLGIAHPIIQAPMAGVSTPELAAAVSQAGALGSIGVGASTPAQAQAAIARLRALGASRFNVNVFTHAPGRRDHVREQAWLAHLAPHFARFGAQPPAALSAPYPSFVEDDAMLEVLVRERVPVVSFHFGLPRRHQVLTLKEAGCVLMATATTPAEGLAIEAAGIDIVVAQGVEAGGHRGVFDPARGDAQLGTLALVRLLVRLLRIPVVAAGGIMDGAGIRAALQLGAQAAQLGTAFIACPESSASDYHRTLLAHSVAPTVVTDVISGRPARGLVDAFVTQAGTPRHPRLPDYPVAYDAAKALQAAAARHADQSFSACWAGQAYALSRPLPAAELVRTLVSELDENVSR